MHVFAEALVGKFDDLIRLQIKNRDRLHGHGFLRAVAVVQERGVAAIRAQCDGRGKAVGAADAAGGGNSQGLAGGQRDRRGRRLFLRAQNRNL